MLFDVVFVAFFDAVLIKTKIDMKCHQKTIVENDEKKHRENESHTAWERYFDGKPVATVTCRETNVIKQIKKWKRAGTLPHHDSNENHPT